MVDPFGDQCYDPNGNSIDVVEEICESLSGNYNWVPTGVNLSVQPGPGGAYTYAGPNGESVSNQSASELGASPIQACINSSACYSPLNLPDNLDDDHSDPGSASASPSSTSPPPGDPVCSRIGGPKPMLFACTYACEGPDASDYVYVPMYKIQNACGPSWQTCPIQLNLIIKSVGPFVFQGGITVVKNSCVGSS